jgi:DNA (cytosine-5)-methyltransferase 1
MIRIFECFAGYGTATFALKQLNIEHKVVGFSEIDKYAIQYFEQNHGSKNFGDITKIDWSEVPNFDLLTGGFPCQSFSVAGKGLGYLDERGVLANYLTKALQIKQPKYFMFENVKGFMSKKHSDFRETLFNDWKNAGYEISYQVLNTREHGIPQNRERVFIVGIRKDLEQTFVFPEKEQLKFKLKDLLDEEVNEKYFLKPEQVEKIMAKGSMRNRMMQKKDISGTLLSRDYKDPKCIELTKGVSDAQRIYSENGCAKTLKGLGGGQGAKTGLYMVGELKENIVKRKFDTPKEINEFLKKHKLPFTNREIAIELNIPKTQVEHYFRTDDSRAIPSKDIWFKLKEFLKFDDSFDKLVCETIEKENEFEMNQRVYSSEGVARTLTNSKETGLYAVGCAICSFPRTGSNDKNRVQRLELNGKEEANSITNVQKDSMVMVYDDYNSKLKKDSNVACSITQQIGNAALRHGQKLIFKEPTILDLYNKKERTDYSITLTEPHHNNLRLGVETKVRRLTPKECFRLQGFLKDEVNLEGLSDTQKYKLAGNGQSVNVVRKIFKELIEKEGV